MENSPKVGGASLFKKLTKSNNYPKGKNVPNMVTLYVGVSFCSTPLFS
jgi:hypothetical protein